MIRLLRAVALAVALAPVAASAVLPREIARAFLDQGVPLDHVGIVVQETGPRTKPLFTLQPDKAMNPASVANTGGSQGHLNMAPFLGLNFIGALQGIFPSPT